MNANLGASSGSLFGRGRASATKHLVFSSHSQRARRKRSFTIVSLVVVLGVFSSISPFCGRALAQKEEKEPQITESTVADTKYGQGGVKITGTGEKYKLYWEKWKDKDGKIRETHEILYEEDKEGKTQKWLFFTDFPTVVGTFTTWKGKLNGSTGINEKDLSDQQIAELMEEVGNQFARDRTLPKTLKEIQENVRRTKVEKEGLVETKAEPPEMWRSIDPQLIGTWECTSFKEAVNSVSSGGTGFRVTFKSDGTESVDYSNMKPIISGIRDKTTYSGTATARISTRDGVAKVEKIVSAGVVMTVDSATGNFSFPKLPGLGPGALGSTNDKNSYKCSEDTLEYQTSAARDGHANTTVKLTRVKGTK